MAAALQHREMALEVHLPELVRMLSFETLPIPGLARTRAAQQSVAA